MTLSPRADAPFSTKDHIFVSILWLALFAQWVTVVPIIVPDQIAGLVGQDNVAKEGISGSVIAAGAALALILAPIAGALSDRWRGARGRRRPFLWSGVLGSCVGLFILTLFGPGGSVLLYALAFLHLQFWWNWAAGPYAGLIPDVVPAAAQPKASAWMNVATILGTILGNALLPLLYRPDRMLPIVIVFVALNLACLGVTLWRVREPPATGPSAPFDFGAFARSFYLDPRRHGNFYWVLATRLMANLGIWSVFTFLLYYVETVLHVERGAAVQLVPALFGAGAVLAIPASLAGVRLAERVGIVRVVWLTSWIMAAAAIGYVLIALYPRLYLVVPLVLLFSVAFGAYGAVDWALALRVLPAGMDAGKDMGIWHISMVLPQMIGPGLTGWLITGLSVAASPRLGYVAAFALAAFWFVLAAILVRRVRLPTATALTG